MLQHLSIKNYALIAVLDLDFKAGFTIITGETGAGKSIILDAIALLLGTRAEVEMLRDKTEKCIIEAIFELKTPELLFFLQKKDLDLQEKLVVRREITPEGKSRAFVNDTPVNLTTLKELSPFLLTIVAQQTQGDLTQKKFQFQVLDAYAKIKTEQEKFATEFNFFQQKNIELETLKNTQKTAHQEKDYQQYLYEELVTAYLQKGELSTLEIQEKRNSQAEIYQQLLYKAEQFFNQDQGILTQIKQTQQLLQKIDLPEIVALKERLATQFLELQDLSAELEHQLQHIQADPEQLQHLRQRISVYYQLMKKHQVQDADLLIDLQKNLEEKIESFSDLHQKIELAEQEQDKRLKKLKDQANFLHFQRLHHAPILTRKIEELLAKMGMPQAQLTIQLTEKKLDSYGHSEVQFLLKSNAGMDFQPIEKIASGGEISRILLAIYSVFAEHQALPTLILDEIDTGVSGEIASQMAEMMQNLAQHLQILTITHLPQVAAKGTQHLHVYKEEKDDKTFTHVHYLDPTERIQKIALMLSGSQISLAAEENAKELLKI